MIGAATLATILGWCYAYMKTHRRSLLVPIWINAIRICLYAPFTESSLSMDTCVHRLCLVQRSRSNGSRVAQRNGWHDRRA